MHRSLTTVVLVAVLALVAFFAGAETAHAQFSACSSVDSATFTGTCSGSASKYSFTLLAFKLRPSAGADHTLVSSSKSCDAGAVAPGAEACVFGESNLTIPANTYTGFVLEINRTFTASGEVTLAGRPTCTATNASTTIDVPASGGTLTFEAFGDNNLRVAFTLTQSIKLEADITIDFTLTFDAGAGVLYTFPAFAGACTSTAAGPLSMSMNFDCKAGPCPPKPSKP